MRFALIGKPLGHSLSPQIHTLISELSGLPCEYLLQPLERDQVRAFIRNMRDNGLHGLNATIPYKLDALQSVDSLSPKAQAVGAVNTVELSPEGLVGHNTDYHGFGAMLREAGVTVKGERCAILGSGGAARAAAAYLLDAGASDVLLVSRDSQEAAARFHGVEAVSYDALPGISGGLIVNCTPVGMHPHAGPSPVPEAVVGRFAAVADLIYNPRQTTLLAMAKHLGCRTADGLMMLAAQAVKAREIWHRRPIAAPVAREVCRRLDELLGSAR